MKIAPDFPDYRHQDPKRQAELGVYQQIAASGVPGVTLYECHPTPSSPEVDFVIIREGVAHFAVQVKGGHWRLEEGQFQLLTDQGWVNKTAPPTQACDAAYAVRNAVRAVLGWSIYVISIMLFPDMEPDADLLNWRANHALAMLFGKAPIIDRLLDCAQAEGVEIFHPPTAADIAEELKVLIPALAPASELTVARAPEGQDPGIPQVHIHVHVHLN